ncbi:DUF4865 family protein [Erwinia sp. CPCC 100877]|nr:DUF4865 family protein [Erwinia sp. CPCC 100877]
MIPEELGKVIIYNLEKWQYAAFTFFENKSVATQPEMNVYALLHLSLGD